MGIIPPPPFDFNIDVRVILGEGTHCIAHKFLDANGKNYGRKYDARYFEVKISYQIFPFANM